MMRIRNVRFVFVCLVFILVGGAAVMEIAARLGELTETAAPPELSAPPYGKWPYYAVRQEGALAFVGAIEENKAAPEPAPESASEDDTRPGDPTGVPDDPTGDGGRPDPQDGTDDTDNNGNDPYGEGTDNERTTDDPYNQEPEPRPEDRYDYGDTGTGVGEPAGPTWKKWEKYEARFKLNWTFANPYDPDDITIDAIITTPSGKVEGMPAFWYVPCARSIVRREKPSDKPDEDTPYVESIRQDGDGTWMLRYTPREEGVYRYRLVARTSTASAHTEKSFRVDGSTGRGFVRVSPGRRYFGFDDGTFHFPIGQNVCWANDMGSVAFRAYLATMRTYGANWGRIWLTHFFRGQTIEWTPNRPYYYGLGFYSPEMAWKLDQMLEAAEQNGIYLMWCLQHHGQFSTRYNPDWHENPYNSKNGGFLDSPEQYFTHPQARDLLKQRVRYYVARYGYSPHVFAWEFWNEVDLTDYFDSAVVTAWHKEMGDYVKSIDPTGRLVSTSYIYGWDNQAFDLPCIDFTQVHIYHGSPSEYFSWSIKSIETQMNHVPLESPYRKPILIGEYGLGHEETYFENKAGAKWPVDPDGLHVHNSLWMGLFSGSAGTAMNWWWDKYIHKQGLYSHFEGISRYLAGEDLRQRELNRVKLFDEFYRTPAVLAYLLVGPDRAYGWVFETAYTIKNFAPSDGQRENVRIEIEDLEDGEYQVEFWNTYDGVATSRTTATAAEGRLAFTLPPFRGDLALKVYRGRPRAAVQEATPRYDRMMRQLKKLDEQFSDRRKD